MSLGLGFGMGFGGGGAAADPIAALNLTLYLDGADYVAGTAAWPGKASAGTSATHSASSDSPGNDPTAGATLNGIQTVAFAAASSQRLQVATALSNIVTASAWSFSVLLFHTPAGAPQCVFGDKVDGYFVLNVKSTPSWNPTQYSGGYNTLPDVAMADSTWQILQARYNGTNVEARVNSGAWAVQAQGNIGSLIQQCRIGANYTPAAFFGGRIASIQAAQVRWSDGDADTIKSALNTRFALAL